MRTTLRIDDDLIRELKERAHRERVPLTELVNQLIRLGLQSPKRGRTRSSPPYREQVFSMGQAHRPLNKALSLAAALEDEEVVEEMARRK